MCFYSKSQFPLCRYPTSSHDVLSRQQSRLRTRQGVSHARPETLQQQHGSLVPGPAVNLLFRAGGSVRGARRVRRNAVETSCSPSDTTARVPILSSLSYLSRPLAHLRLPSLSPLLRVLAATRHSDSLHLPELSCAELSRHAPRHQLQAKEYPIRGVPLGPLSPGRPDLQGV